MKKLSGIQFLEALKTKPKVIITTDKKIMTLQTFKNIIQFLPEKEFVRVHNSYIIAISKIDNIERNRIKIRDEMIPISDSYKENFYNLLRERKYLI